MCIRDSKYIIYSQNKDLRIKRFGYVIICPDLKTPYYIFLQTLSRKKNYRYIRVSLLDFFGECKSVHFRHHHIEYTYIWFVLTKHFPSLFSVSSQFYIKAAY